MKEYNRQTKRWEDPVDKVGTLKKKKLCIGKIPHDYQLSLPRYLDEHQNLPQETIEEYYNSEERVRQFTKKEEDLLVSLGIKKRSRYNPMINKYFLCSKCGKREYDI